LIDGERNSHSAKPGQTVLRDYRPRRDLVLLDVMVPEMQRKTQSISFSAKITSRQRVAPFA